MGGTLAMSESAPAELARLADRLALRPQEAARALGISERKLREILPELPHIRRGGVVMIPIPALESWLAQEAKATASETREAEQILSTLRRRRT